MKELIPYEKKNSFHFSICCGIRSLPQFVVVIRSILQSVVVFRWVVFTSFTKNTHRAIKSLQLQKIPGKYGFRDRCGIGVKGLDRYVERALQSGEPVVVINQTGYMLRHVAERRVAVKYVPIKEEI